jgi:galactose-1-phosphate uridylyltransferase
VVLTRAHTLQLNEFTTPVLFNGLRAALTYVQTVFQRHPDVKHAAVAMNYLPPAGSTIVHPHMQVIASYLPLAYPRQLEEASQRYARLNKSNYWDDLMRVESERGERYLAQRGRTHWIAPYAPAGLNEIDGIVLDRPSLRSLTEDDLKDLAEGMRSILMFYYDRGVRSFNALLYSSTLGSESNAVSVGLKVVSRYGYRARFVSDVWSLQYLLNEQEVYEAPEMICSEARPYVR